MIIHVVTGFPGFFESPCSVTIINRAVEKGLVSIRLHDLRDYTTDKHKSIDDAPYGGGAGMILMVEPIAKAITAIKDRYPEQKIQRIFLTPQGKTLTQQKAQELAEEKQLVLLCGRYRGIDERVRELCIDEEVSVGDYILSGGEPAALIVMDAIIRLIPGVVGDPASIAGDSFQSGYLDHPHYTRPEDFQGRKVPEVLLSGDHQAVDAWRKQMAEKRTRKRRPDLIKPNGRS